MISKPADLSVTTLKFSFSLLFFAVLTASVAQQTSTVHYDDGQKFIGEIIGQDKSHVIIRTTRLDTIYLKKAEISKIKNSKDHIKLYRRHQSSGIFYDLDLLCSATAQGETAAISMTVGSRLSSAVSVGGGVGHTANVISSRSFGANHGMAQLYGFSRYHFNQNAIRPFVELKLGWGIATPTEAPDTHHGGAFGQPSFGVEIATRKRLSWTVKLSQYIQRVNGVNFFNTGFDRNFPASVSYRSLLNRTALSFGISF